jgi:hypothetical protein
LKSGTVARSALSFEEIDPCEHPIKALVRGDGGPAFDKRPRIFVERDDMDVDIESASANELQHPLEGRVDIAALDPGDEGLRHAGTGGHGLLGHPCPPAGFSYQLPGVHLGILRIR